MEENHFLNFAKKKKEKKKKVAAVGSVVEMFVFLKHVSDDVIVLFIDLYSLCTVLYS